MACLRAAIRASNSRFPFDQPVKQRLVEFTKSQRLATQKGALSIILLVCQHARGLGLPLDPDKLLTKAGTQVLGAGRDATQRVLARLGEKRVLSAEGGRTSRGSVGTMRAYVDILNDLHARGICDLDAIEQYWLSVVQAFFEGKPFKLKMDTTHGLRTIVRDVLDQAKTRQQNSTGTQYQGAVLQHMVGAKLDCALGQGRFAHNSYSTSDQQSGRPGDFAIGDVAVHVSTSPSEAMMARCKANIDNGLRPIVVTLSERVAFTDTLTEQQGLKGRVDVFDIEQFVALNVYELGKFELSGRRTAVADIVNRYNEIIDEVETDPSLKIEPTD